MTTKTPSQWAANDPDAYDCTAEIGPLGGHERQGRPWAMYSYDRPAYMLWNAIARGLHKRGWTDEQIKDWLQSTAARHSLDGSLGEALEKLGGEFAEKIPDDWRLRS